MYYVHYMKCVASNTENGNTANIDKVGDNSPFCRTPITNSMQPKGTWFQYTLLTHSALVSQSVSHSVSQEANDTAIEHSKLMLH